MIYSASEGPQKCPIVSVGIRPLNNISRVSDKINSVFTKSRTSSLFIVLRLKSFEWLDCPLDMRELAHLYVSHPPCFSLCWMMLIYGDRVLLYNEFAANDRGRETPFVRIRGVMKPRGQVIILF